MTYEFLREVVTILWSPHDHLSFSVNYLALIISNLLMYKNGQVEIPEVLKQRTYFLKEFLWSHKPIGIKNYML